MFYLAQPHKEIRSVLLVALIYVMCIYVYVFMYICVYAFVMKAERCHLRLLADWQVPKASKTPHEQPKGARGGGMLLDGPPLLVAHKL